MAKRGYGDGSVYQRCDARRGCPARVPAVIDGEEKLVRPEHKCSGLWVGTIENGWRPGAKRDRIILTAAKRSDLIKKLERRKRELAMGQGIGVSDKVTLKQWLDEYLALRSKPPKALSPNALNAARSPITKWIIPTIGHKRLGSIMPADLLTLAQAQYDAGRKVATADATQRALMTALNYAVKHGHMIPMQTLKADRPGMGTSDRTDLPLDATLACLDAARDLPHRLRWWLALAFGVRLGESSGLTLDAIDRQAKIITLDWQLQTLKYKEKGKPKAGFEVSQDYETKHLSRAYHLVRPKHGKVRTIPLLPEFEEELDRWLEVRPDNPWALVFPRANGQPMNDKVDREEWWAIQCTAGVGHPNGRWYHIHECRNSAATQLDEIGASDLVVTSILGHASIKTSRGYQTAHMAAKREAGAAVSKRLGLT